MGFLTDLRRKIFDILEASVYATRILLIPFYACLVIALLIYGYVISSDTIEIVKCLFSSGLEEGDLLIKVLGIVDIVMIANLIIMILIGSYSIFVRKMDAQGVHNKKPQWLDHISSGSLKVKISMSIVGVSSIHLLKVFIEVDKTGIGTKSFIVKMVIHAFFILAAFAMAKTNKIVEQDSNSLIKEMTNEETH